MSCIVCIYNMRIYDKHRNNALSKHNFGCNYTFVPSHIYEFARASMFTYLVSARSSCTVLRKWPIEVIHKLGHSSRPSITSALKFCLSYPISEFIPRFIGTLSRREVIWWKCLGHISMTNVITRKEMDSYCIGPKYPITFNVVVYCCYHFHHCYCHRHHHGQVLS